MLNLWLCRFWRHARPDSRVTVFEEEGILTWQCPRCGALCEAPAKPDEEENEK